MIENLINPSEYRQTVVACIDHIKTRMKMTNTQYTDDDIRVFDVSGVIFVLANPVLGDEAVFDADGDFEKMVPMHNLTVMPNGHVNTPSLRILRPDLCMRIELDGAITDGSF